MVNESQIVSQKFDEVVFLNENFFVKKMFFLEKCHLRKIGNLFLLENALTGGELFNMAYNSIDALLKETGGFEIEYSYIGNLHEGLAKVAVEGRGFGFVDEELKLIIAPKYISARDFKNGFAVVSVLDNESGEKKIFFIDREGKEYFFEKNYVIVSDYHEGLFQVSDSNIPEDNLAFYSDYSEEAGVWGYADSSGKEIIEPQYIYALAFSNGIAFVCKGKWTKDNKWNNKYRYGAYWTDTELWGAIDKTGKEVIPCIYDEITNLGFMGALDFVWAHYGGWEKGKWGIINHCGERLVEPMFEDYGYSISDDGLITFHNENKWNDPDDQVPMGIYSIKEKKVLFEPQFLDVDFFSDGTIMVEVYDEKLGINIQKLIDVSGKPLFESQYISIHKNFRNKNVYDVSIPDNTGKWLSGVVDKNGNEILPCKYKTRFDGFIFDLNLIIFEENEKYGIVTFDDKVLVPPQYTSIERTNNISTNVIFNVGSGGSKDSCEGKRGLITLDGSVIIPTEYIYISFHEDFIVAENESGATFYKIFFKEKSKCMLKE